MSPGPVRRIPSSDAATRAVRMLTKRLPGWIGIGGGTESVRASNSVASARASSLFKEVPSPHENEPLDVFRFRRQTLLLSESNHIAVAHARPAPQIAETLLPRRGDLVSVGLSEGPDGGANPTRDVGGISNQPLDRWSGEQEDDRVPAAQEAAQQVQMPPLSFVQGVRGRDHDTRFARCAMYGVCKVKGNSRLNKMHGRCRSQRREFIDESVSDSLAGPVRHFEHEPVSAP